MAYMRGDNYIWTGTDDRVHVWIGDGDDGWRESGWALADDDTLLPGREHASGVALPVAVMDEFVVMRFAELLQAGEVDAAVDRALRNHDGNFGCAALVERATQLKST